MRNIYRTTSITLFSLAFLLGSVSVPFLSNADAGTEIDFIKQVKQEGQTSYVQDLTVTDSSKPVIFRIYVLNPTATIYTNGSLRDEFPFDQTGRVRNRAIVDAEQIQAVFSDAHVNLPAGKKLIYRANSTRVYGYQDSVGTSIPDVNGQSALITPQGLRINQIRGGSDQYKHWYVFFADIVNTSVPTPKPAPSMEMKKEVNNLTANSGFVSSVSAAKGDVLEYRIWVHNKVVGSTAQNLVVKDELPVAEGQTFVNKAIVSGSNFTTISSTANVNTAFVGRLEYVPNTTRVFGHADNSEGSLVADVSGKSKLFTTGVKFDEMKGCFEFEKFVTFRVKVIKPEVKEFPPQELPNTGPSAGLFALLGSVVPAGFILKKFRTKI